MITKSELQKAYRTTGEDAEASGIPTAEEVLAYVEGKLSPEDDARVRALLIAHPEMLRAASQPFPSEDAAPGDADYLSPAEVTAQWRTFQGVPVSTGGGRVLQFWRVSAALAAGLAVVLGSLLWLSESKQRRLSHELGVPRITGYQMLMPDGQRGLDGVSTLTPVGDTYVIATPFFGAEPFDRYRLEIIDGAKHLVWRSEPVARPDNDTFVTIVPRATLKQGSFQIVLYGISGSSAQPVATYSFVVPALLHRRGV